MEEKQKQRRTVRLKAYDYSAQGVYFVTVCVKDRQKILSRIVGTGVPDGPQGEEICGVVLLKRGEIAERVLRQMSDFYEHLSVDAYVIMPDHIHFLLQIKEGRKAPCGPSGTPVPTQNSTLSRFVSTFKRFCNKEYGENIWQRRSYDHVIRGQEDYEEHIKYIYENPMRWHFDELYKKADFKATRVS